MDKKKICTITILLHTIQLFASDITSRGRISSGHNDFTGFIIAILAIGLGGIFAYFFISDGIKMELAKIKNGINSDVVQSFCALSDYLF